MIEHKISVIVPIYNAEQYLRECLESIMNQKYNNLEIILINDGSRDRSEEICCEYIKKDNRFQLYSINNSGSGAARNKGLEYATGEYIGFIDADDWIEEDFFSSLMYIQNKYNADVVMSDWVIQDKTLHDWDEAVFTSKTEFFNAYLNGGICNLATICIYRKSAIRGLQFPVRNRDNMEDAAWTSMVLEKVNIVARAGGGKYHYRIVENSITHKKMSDIDKCGMYRNRLEKLQRCTMYADLSDVYICQKLVQEIESIISEMLIRCNDLFSYSIYEIARDYCTNNMVRLSEKSWLMKLLIDYPSFKKARIRFLIHYSIVKPIVLFRFIKNRWGN